MPYNVFPTRGQSKKYLDKYKEERWKSLLIFEILVPIETVSEVKNGKKRQRENSIQAIFINMKLFDDVGQLAQKPWYNVKDSDGVINFIGSENLLPSAMMKSVGFLSKSMMLREKKCLKSNLASG